MGIDLMNEQEMYKSKIQILKRYFDMIKDTTEKTLFLLQNGQPILITETNFRNMIKEYETIYRESPY